MGDGVSQLQRCSIMWEETPPAFHEASTGIIIEQITKYSTEFATEKSDFV